MVHSSKGVSSVFMARWIGVTQKTAWKMCHAIRHMMEPTTEQSQPLSGVVELDEKYFGGKPRHKVGVRFKRGKASNKQCVFVAVQRKGPVRSALVDSDKTSILKPLVDGFVQPDAHLMTDQNHSYRKIGQEYAGHSWVNHSMEEFSRDGVNNNTAESFNSLLERAKLGVFHYMSTQHLQKYLNEIGFRWDHRIPVEKKTKKGKTKIKMVPLPVMQMLYSLLSRSTGKQNRRTKNSGIVCYSC
jgi:transposase-like protein